MYCIELKSESQDQIRLHWQSGKSAVMNVLVAHAMIILLICGQPTGIIIDLVCLTCFYFLGKKLFIAICEI